MKWKLKIFFDQTLKKVSSLVDMGKFLSTAAEKIPTFCGIKFTSNDLEEGTRALAANERFAVFLGADAVNLPKFIFIFGHNEKLSS